MKNPATSFDVIRFVDATIPRYQAEVDKHDAWVSGEEAKHNATIWYRWFKIEHSISIWDYGSIVASNKRYWIKELQRLRVKAQYCMDKGFEPVDIPNDWADLFYDWIGKNPSY